MAASLNRSEYCTIPSMELRVPGSGEMSAMKDQDKTKEQLIAELESCGGSLPSENGPRTHCGRTWDKDEANPEEPLTAAATKGLVHELQVHQIELEMQNEELRRTQSELEASRTRYFELYDLAPVGYFTVSENGMILEANTTGAGLLGVGEKRFVQAAGDTFHPS